MVGDHSIKFLRWASNTNENLVHKRVDSPNEGSSCYTKLANCPLIHGPSVVSPYSFQNKFLK